MHCQSLLQFLRLSLKNTCFILIFLSCSLSLSSLNAQNLSTEIARDSLGKTTSDTPGLFVLQLGSTGMTESAAQVFSNIIAQNLNNLNRFKVITTDQAEEIAQKKNPELLPCFEIGCGLQIGKMMNAVWVLSGHITLNKTGSFSMNVKLVNILDNSMVFDDTIRFNDENMDRRFYFLAHRIADNVPLIGKVLEANNKLVVVSLGEHHGVEVGHKLIIYKNYVLQKEEGVSNSKKNRRRKNISIVKVTKVGARVSEAVYFQSIETPKPNQLVTTYLDFRKQTLMVDTIRKELDTHERNVYEITKEVNLTPVQLSDMEKTKWVQKVRTLEEAQKFWQFTLLGSGVGAIVILSQAKAIQDWQVAATIAVAGYSSFELLRLNSLLDDLIDEGRYKGYLDLKIRPNMNEVGLNYKLNF